MVFANLTYLDSPNRYTILCPYKALMGLSEKVWFLLSHIHYKNEDNIRD